MLRVIISTCSNFLYFKIFYNDCFAGANPGSKSEPVIIFLNANCAFGKA